MSWGLLTYERKGERNPWSMLQSAAFVIRSSDCLLRKVKEEKCDERKKESHNSTISEEVKMSR